MNTTNDAIVLAKFVLNCHEETNLGGEYAKQKIAEDIITAITKVFYLLPKMGKDEVKDEVKDGIH